MTVPSFPAGTSGDAPPLDPALLGEIELALDAEVRSSPFPENLRAACAHAVLAGGKRLRPILVLESARALGATPSDAMRAAVAIEFVHAFSLVHDDLPALDNDDMRRGRPTCHIAFGEAMAILAGDALLARAPIVAATSPRNGGAIASVLLEATGDMIAGQVLDTLGGFASDEPPTSRLERIHRCKTGALIEASCRMGALAAGASSEAVHRLAEFGGRIGLMFQIVDDLIDATQSADHAGKATGKDAAAGKLTYPVVHGIEGSRREVGRLRLASLGSLEPLGAPAARLRELVEFLANRTR
jgi:geranylgeranyl pyrophosphate synthase